MWQASLSMIIIMLTILYKFSWHMTPYPTPHIKPLCTVRKAIDFIDLRRKIPILTMYFLVTETEKKIPTPKMFFCII